MEYRYDAAGNRISKYIYNNSSSVTKSFEYIGGYVIENDILSYYSMAEGRVRNEGGGFGLSMKMEYFITDQQGNVRVSFEDNNGTALLKQENSYYAFGMQMAGGYIPGTNPNKKLYNAGSEWQDDIEGLADYYSTFFREYDPVIGRFNGVDPMSESFESWTTYHYSYNNPVNFNDPLGDAAARARDNRPDPGYLLGLEMQAEYKAWHDARYGDNSSWSTVQRLMTIWGWGDWSDVGGGGGSYNGSYQQLKDHLAYVGTDEWKMEMFNQEKSKYFWALKMKWKKQGFAEAGEYWFGDDGEGHFNPAQTLTYFEVINSSGEVIGTLDVKMVSDYSESRYDYDQGKWILAKGIEMHVGYKDQSSGYTDFNWIQIIKTNTLIPNTVFRSAMTYDGEYIHNDFKDNEPFYNSTNNEKTPYTQKYTTGFEDAPLRATGRGNVRWQAMLSLMGGNKYPDNRMFNIHYGFTMDSRGRVSMISPSAVSNQFSFR